MGLLRFRRVNHQYAAAAGLQRDGLAVYACDRSGNEPG
jgi:hypothetical protein